MGDRRLCPACRVEREPAPGTGACSSCGAALVPPGVVASIAAASGVRRVGRYELLEPLGSGGCGVVWKARDPELDRPVAIKLLRADLPDDILRLQREAQIAARLHHPNIVAVHDVGVADGQAYVAMEFVDGKSADRLELPGREAATLVRDAARAVQHAHEQGVIHRDLKPGNIMLDRGGRTVVMDFGMAKVAEIRSSLSLSGTILGTPSYMSPEQADGKSREADARSDVWGLGATLYALMTGRPPFEGTNILDVAKRVVDTEPIPPRRINPDIPRDIELVVLKCMEKEKARRYGSAGLLAEDLDAFLAREPVRHARPSTFLYYWSKRIRRRPLPWALGAVAVLALLAGSAFGIYWLFRARAVAVEKARAEAKGRRETEAALAIAERRTREATERLAHNYLLRADQAAADDDLASAALLYAEAFRLSPSPAARASAAYALRSLPRLAAILEAGGPLAAVVASPDGRTLATETLDGAVQFWELEGARPIGGTVRLKDLAFTLAFAVDGRTLATVESAAVRFWHVPEGREKGKPIEKGAPPPSFGRDLKRVLVCGPDGVTRVWDCDNRTAISTITDRACGVAVLSPDGLLAAIADEGLVHVRHAETGKEKGGPRAHGAPVHAMAFSPDGRNLATAGVDGIVRIWNLDADKEDADLLHSTPVSRVLYGPDGECVATVSNDGRSVHLWRVRTRELIRRPLWCGDALWSPFFAGRLAVPGRAGAVRILDAGPAGAFSIRHGGEVSAVCLHPDGRRVGTAGLDGKVRLWEMPQPDRPPRVRAKGDDIPLAVDLHPTGLMIATHADQGVRLWDLRTGQRIPDPADGPVFLAVVSPDGRRIALADTRSVRFREIGKASAGPIRVESDVRSIAFGPDGARVAIGCEDGSILIRPGGAAMKQEGSVDRLAFSPDGSRIASACEKGFARLWNAATGEAVGAPTPVSRRISVDSQRTPLLFSPDGRLLATVADAKVRLHSASTGMFVREMEVDAFAGDALVFSPDGRRLAASRSLKSVAVWDTEDGRRLVDDARHAGVVRSAAYSPDGNFLATGAEDGSVGLWDAATRRPIGPPLSLDFPATTLVFVRDGRGLAVADDRTGNAAFLDIGFLVDAAAPELLVLRARAATGLRVGESGEIEAIPAGEWSRSGIAPGD